MRECSSWCLAAVVVGVVGPVALAQWTFTNLHPTGAAESAAMGVGAAGGTVRVVGYAGVGANYHAALWGTTAATFVDLHPVTTAGPNSIAHATDGVQQVGVVFSSSPIGAASIWTGTAASWQSVTPVVPFGTVGVIYGVAANVQVGATTTGGTGISRQATSWSAVGGLLNRGGTALLATDGASHVGYSGGQGFPIPSAVNAGLWLGSNVAGTSLHPAGMHSSSAAGVSGAQQVGWYQTSQFSDSRRACLWTGTGASKVDLHPATAVRSEATGVSAGVQVGSVYVTDPANPFGTVSRAAAWSGTAASFVNLHDVLPPTYATSVASGVWSGGGMTYVSGNAWNNTTSRTEAVLWVFTAGQACDSIDFNGDGLFPDTQDIADFLTVFGGGVCAGQQPAEPPCNVDIDMNNDGLFPDTEDIGTLIRVFGGGECQ